MYTKFPRCGMMGITKKSVIVLLYSEQNYKKNIIKTTKHNSLESTLLKFFLGQLSFFFL